MKRYGLALALPSFLLLILLVAPLLLGQKTLFLRDIFSAHVSLKAAQVQQMKAEGRVPLVASALAGGQPLTGNPNAVPLYPDNLLFLVTPFFWAFNAHFWIHLLLAPWAMAWLGRQWGLGWPAAWGAGFFFASSGFFLSQMNLYNLVAGSALAPALVAAALALAKRPGPRATAAFAALWALLLLAGEPLLAAMSLGLAGLAVLLKEGRKLRNPASPKLLFVLSLALGTLVATPQLVEFLRTLPLSYRGHQGYSLAGSTAGSFHWSHTLEWLLPSAFGRPDQLRGGAFWGYPFFDNLPPLFFSLAPGLLVLGLVAVSGLRREPARLWSWLCVGGGIFLALGRSNPIVGALLTLPGGSLLRYPVKVWLVPAMGLALLAGLGLQRLLEADLKETGEDEAGTTSRRRTLSRLLAAGAFGYLVLWAWLSLSPSAVGALRSLIPPSFGAEFLSLEVERWRMLAWVSAALAGLLAVAVAALRAYPGPFTGLLIGLHTASQIFFLHPLLPMDDVQAYSEKPSLLQALPAEGTIVHGATHNLFGRVNLKQGDYPEYTAEWVQRRLFGEAYPPAGILFGRRYELNLSPEGLGSFLTRAARDALRQISDEARLRLLAAWGVEHLVIYRPLDPAGAALATLDGKGQSFGNDLFAYQVSNSVPQISLAAKRIFAPHLNAALGMLSSPTFDPHSMVVLPGEGPPFEGTLGEISFLHQDGESLRVDVQAAGPTTLVWQRSHLPHYRATLDGESVPVLVANLHRMAIAVPAGNHQITIEADRRPFRRACLGSLLGMVALVGLALRRSPAPTETRRVS